MYCYNCGKFFPDEDVVQKRDRETSLHIYCCPHCGVDDIGESVECSVCGKEFTEDEIVEGYCLSCLWEAIDYDVTLEYLKANELLADFILTYIMDAGKIEHSSFDLDRHLEETFRRMVVNDKLNDWFGFKADFLERCRFYCLPYYQNGDFGISGQQFAEWYSDWRKKKGGSQPNAK